MKLPDGFTINVDFSPLLKKVSIDLYDEECEAIVHYECMSDGSMENIDAAINKVLEWAGEKEEEEEEK